MLTIRKRGKYFHCRGTVRVGKKTEYVPERSTGSGGRADAEAYRIELEHQIQQELLHGAAGRQRSMTFATAADDYLGRHGGLNRMDVWRIGELNKVLGGCSVADIAEAWSTFKSVRCQGLAPATVARFRATLQAAIRHACAERQIEAPRLPSVKVPNDLRVRFLTIEERDRLLAAYVPHVRPIALTLCFEGCRTQEALRLLWRDVDLAGAAFFIRETKTDRPRRVIMHQKVKAAIEQLAEAGGRPEGGHVFLNRLGKPYGDTRKYRYPGGNPLSKSHKTACRRAEITDFRVHDWRHHWASHLVMAGVDLITIQRLGGWEGLRMVERYSALSTEHMAAAMAKIA